MPHSKDIPPEQLREITRLSFLRSLHILDTPIEEPFERITRLLARIMKVPIVGISLIDEDRQWFKSIRGLPLYQIPRNESFCAHTILQNDVLVVPDTIKDDRFCGLGFGEQGPNIRFYAGCPLSVGNNINIGAIGVYDIFPRKLADDDIQFLKDITQTTSSEIKARLMNCVYSNTVL